MLDRDLIISVFDLQLDQIILSSAAFDDLTGDQRLDAALNVTLHRTGAKHRIHALRGDQTVDLIADLQTDVLPLQTLRQLDVYKRQIVLPRKKHTA